MVRPVAMLPNALKGRQEHPTYPALQVTKRSTYSRKYCVTRKYQSCVILKCMINRIIIIGHHDISKGESESVSNLGPALAWRGG